MAKLARIVVAFVIIIMVMGDIIDFRLDQENYTIGGHLFLSAAVLGYIMGIFKGARKNNGNY